MSGNRSSALLRALKPRLPSPPARSCLRCVAQIIPLVASGTYVFLYISIVLLAPEERPLDYGALISKSTNHVMHNNDRLAATAEREGGGRESGRLGVRAMCSMPIIKEN